MFGLMDTDNSTKLNYDRTTGGFNRSWIRYADNTFEPVRKQGVIRRKKRSPDPAKDWWVVDRPQDWNPAEHGFNVTLNHDYGEDGKPSDLNRPGQDAKVQPVGRAETLELTGRDKGRVSNNLHPLGMDDRQPTGQKQAAETSSDQKKDVPRPKSSLGEGRKAYEEFETRREAAKSEEKSEPRNAAQDAAELNRREKRKRSSAEHARDVSNRERKQGIIPNQDSGHEQRPPSASKDAAELEHASKKESLEEYLMWLKEIKKSPPWQDQEMTPAEKVQKVTEPLGKEAGKILMELILKNSGSSLGRLLGHTLGKTSPFVDVLTNPRDAW